MLILFPLTHLERVHEVLTSWTSCTRLPLDSLYSVHVHAYARVVLFEGLDLIQPYWVLQASPVEAGAQRWRIVVNPLWMICNKSGQHGVHEAEVIVIVNVDHGTGAS